ncbi:uncharacterized protein HaLaN_17008 [Haematococcus lacustris]|uniref:Uncharacterized protein n=1 Tax=Haematococcus lacustris TaxID=44745 RepID=A0A699ZDR2_HAELA|nr:uncharacterized protein HaLaN_17008 [Haematococcus lacustris]
MAAAVAILGQQAAQPGPASAVRASSLCVDALTEEADAECRRAALAGDIDQLNNYGTASTSRKFAAVLNDEYTVATLKLGSEIEEYCALDVYDKGRVPLIKSLKSDGTAWVSK